MTSATSWDYSVAVSRFFFDQQTWLGLISQSQSWGLDYKQGGWTSHFISQSLGTFPLCQYWGRWGKMILKYVFKQVLRNDTGYASSSSCQIHCRRDSCGHSPLGSGAEGFESPSSWGGTHAAAPMHLVPQELSLHECSQKVRLRGLIEGLYIL